VLNIGREIVAEALRSGDAKPYIEAGMDLEFMRDHLKPAYAAVFTGQDIDAWTQILRHQKENKHVPDLKLFRQGFPEGTYDLPVSRTTCAELISLARNAIGEYHTQVGHSEAGRYIDAGDPEGAAEIMLATARKVLRQQQRGAVRRSWDNKDYDLEQRLAVRVKRGPGFGIPELDKQFPGFQAGQLITLLGRAKSNKTTFLIASAFHSWMGKTVMPGSMEPDIDPRRVMLVTTEITEDGIRDRLTAYGAGVNPSRLLASTDDHHVTGDDEDMIRAFWAREVEPYADDALQVVQPYGKYSVENIEMDAESMEPGIILIDGFYFLTDPVTGRMGSHWEGHDNLARDLKALAMRLNVPVVVTHQVREKQLGKAGGGIDDGAMMGGTGLRMASDLVMTLDKDENHYITIKNTASRSQYLNAIQGQWDWEKFRFVINEHYDPNAGDEYED
jgi:hypothetical protein